MALFAGFFPRVSDGSRRELSQGLTAIPAVLPEGGRRQEISRHAVENHDADGQEHNPQHLGRHVKQSGHIRFSILTLRRCQSCAGFPQ